MTNIFRFSRELVKISFAWFMPPWHSLANIILVLNVECVDSRAETMADHETNSRSIITKAGYKLTFWRTWRFLSLVRDIIFIYIYFNIITDNLQFSNIIFPVIHCIISFKIYCHYCDVFGFLEVKLYLVQSLQHCFHYTFAVPFKTDLIKQT